jgi:hypothetical protein
MKISPACVELKDYVIVIELSYYTNITVVNYGVLCVH